MSELHEEAIAEALPDRAQIDQVMTLGPTVAGLAAERKRFPPKFDRPLVMVEAMPRISDVNEVFLLGRKEARSVFAQAKTDGAVSAKVVSDEKSSIFFRKDSGVDYFQSALFGLARVESGQDFCSTMICGSDVGRPWKGVVDT